MKALVVEDDVGIARGVSFALTQAGYANDVCHTLAQAWTLLQTEAFDLVVLDLGLPDGDGHSLLARLRCKPQTATQGTAATVPVLIMTARDNVQDRIAGLDHGADDYVVKPFDVNELVARIRAIQRRMAGRASPVWTYQYLTLDPASREVTWQNQPVVLSPREYELLFTLLQASPRVLSKSQLEASLYPLQEGLESNAIEVHVHHIRRKIADHIIQTVRGVGYTMPAKSAS
jgi:two-component system, OmpR family, response regulator QseB